MVFLIRSLLILSLLCTNSFGAISAAMVWEHRTTGNANNGCGYKTGATGTDFSQQNAAQYSLTGVTSAGAGAVALTASAAADMVGNIGNVTGGTNFTTGRREIISVSVGVSITFDANITTGVGASGTIEIGGACTLPTQTAASMVAGNTGWFKNGTYTVTTSPTFTPGANGAKLLLQGYTTTRGDTGTATITSATNSNDILTLNAAAGYQIQQLTLSSSAGTRGNCIKINGVTIDSILLHKLVIDGCADGVLADGNSAFPIMFISQSEFKNCTSDGFEISRAFRLYVIASWFHNNAARGINASGNFDSEMRVVDTVFSNNGSDGVILQWSSNNATSTFVNSNFYTNGGSGISQTANVRQTMIVQNSAFYGNTTFGISWNATTAPEIQLSYNNAFGSNGSGAHSANWSTGTNEITLTGDPFTSSTNFALNNTAGAGAALRGTGFPGVGLFGTGFIDVGALQHQESAAATQRIYGSTN